MKVYEGANTKVQICEGSTSEHEAEGSNDCDNGEKLGSRCSEVHTDEFNSFDDVAKSVETSLVTTCDPLKISAIICYVAARPIIDPIWRYNLFLLSDSLSYGERVQAHPVQDVWPKAFEKCGPNDQSIALYFFPDNERDEKDFDTLAVSMIQDDLAMRAVLEDAELLVFTSVILPEQYRRFQTKFYLWGVFRAKQFPQLTNSSVGVGEKDVAKPLTCYGQSPVSTLSNNVDITCAPVPLTSYCPSVM
ncbi:hypothetical protein C1H46_009137 [Malus baccata]|uniref:AIPP2-like SPOC-like domain-containing protein n=1 Tax=Malus baccata TaxID=106549 RepID=A0A540N440_MALBA|nr:hypothetical protein C1H46_009137 [Malus baccata]